MLDFGLNGKSQISQEMLKKLQTPVMAITVKKDGPAGALVREWYGLGWGIVTVNWASEPLLQHSGSNEKNLAQIWLDPKRDFAMVLATNISGPQASDALLTLAKELYAQFATSKAGETITK